ncbi:UNVERIFIED_CONTAM: Phosphoribosylformylglycinamidine cyclo-ligase, chloroplastic, partial [Sesamum calycinum]
DSYMVAGTIRVGTKLRMAFKAGVHETIGIDLGIPIWWLIQIEWEPNLKWLLKLEFMKLLALI